jgi:hypothetical protein
LEDLEFEKNVPKLKPKYLQIGKTRLKLTSKEPFFLNVKIETRILFKRKNYTTLILTALRNIISFTSKFSPNLNLKNMISTYTKKKKKKISKKKGPNLRDFKERTFQIIIFLQ